MRTLNILLTHQSSAEVAAMLAGWERCVEPGSLLVAHGGSRGDFERIAHGQKVWVDGPRLRTRDHQREKQSYSGVFSAAAQWLRGRDFSHVHLAEYDHVPLVEDLNARQAAFLQSEGADVLGHRVRRVDGTNYPNALYAAADPRFFEYWKTLSCRPDPGVVLRATGTGMFWRRAAFEAVAARPEPFPIYLEIHLPTLAHHLGYRVRDWGAQNRFVEHLGDFSARLEEARAAGAWSAHPVKGRWSGAPVS